MTTRGTWREAAVYMGYETQRRDGDALVQETLYHKLLVGREEKEKWGSEGKYNNKFGIAHPR